MQIQLRQIEVEDLPQLREWRNDDQLRRYVREYRLLNMVNQRDWLDYISRSRDVEMFSIETGDGLGGVCGLCYINWVNRTAEVSLYVAPALRDTNIAAQALVFLQHKAFEEFNLHRLWAEIYEFNLGNIELFEKCGYILEGRLHKHVFKLGKYHDSLMYGLLR